MPRRAVSTASLSSFIHITKMLVESFPEEMTLALKDSTSGAFSFSAAYSMASSSIPETVPMKASVFFVPSNDIGTSSDIHGTSDSIWFSSRRILPLHSEMSFSRRCILVAIFMSSVCSSMIRSNSAGSTVSFPAKLSSIPFLRGAYLSRIATAWSARSAFLSNLAFASAVSIFRSSGSSSSSVTTCITPRP